MSHASRIVTALLVAAVLGALGVVGASQGAGDLMENDRNYGPAAIRSYHRAFTQAGGKADLHLFPPIGHDGHILLPPHVEVWSAAVSDFLDRIGVGRP